MRVLPQLRPIRAAGWLLLLGLLLAACQPIQPTPEAPPQSDANLPAIVDYNLGDASLVETQQAEESRFRTMPVRLNGAIAVPEGDGPFPVALILHGTHPGCPETQHMVDEWPCATEVEQRNYAGWGWLAQRLADAGYIALAPNINAEFTFGWGEAPPGQRLLQLVDLHLTGLATASAGAPDAPDFGVDLAGRADLSNLLLIGHSRGAGEQWRVIRELDLEQDPPPAGQLYGPARGFLAVAPAPTVLDDDPLAIPLTIVLPACDGDVVSQDGQHFYEGLRLAAGQSNWATSLWLKRANHNHFNAILGGDMSQPGERRPDCDPLLAPEEQRQWLGDLAVDFAAAALRDDAAAQARVGLDVAQPPPATRYGQVTRTAAFSPADHRLPLLIPAGEAELATNAQGGAITVEGLTLTFCPPGFYTPATMPGTEPCRRPNFATPGNPQMFVATWETPGASLRLELPAGVDLSAYDSLSLRVAVDPVSPLNAPGAAQGLSLQISDGAGAAVALAVPASPELAFPMGLVEEDEFFAPGVFSAPLPLTTVRVPLSAFAGVDLTDVSAVTLLLDQTERGALFLADVEVVRAEE